MKIQNYFLLVVALLFLFSACESDSDANAYIECDSPPPDFILRVLDQTTDKDLFFEGLFDVDSVELYYYVGERQYDVDLTIAIDSSAQEVFINASKMGWISGDEDVTDFYLYLNQNYIEPFYVDIDPAQSEHCTYYVLNEFTLSGSEVEQDDDYSYLIYEKGLD